MMKFNEFSGFYEEKVKIFEAYLRDSFPKVPSAVVHLSEAMQYSLYAGGKRIRPLLLLTTVECGGGRSDFALPFAGAIEYIHTYSLIHDDLPCMDDDDLRRGLPTSHVKFGEALALLAGDALLTHSFALVSQSTILKDIPAAWMVQAIHLLAEAAGVFGMVTGQVADISQPAFEAIGDSLDFIHRHKTGALIAAAVHIGAVIAGFSEEVTNQLVRFGREIGKCFQIQDDILDEIGDRQRLGKSPGRDRKNDTLTYPRAFGLEKSKALAAQSYENGLSYLAGTGLDTRRLRQLSDFVLKRDH